MTPYIIDSIVTSFNKSLNDSGFKVHWLENFTTLTTEITCRDTVLNMYVKVTIPDEDLAILKSKGIIKLITEGVEKLPRYTRYKNHLIKRNTKLGKILYK